MSSRGLAEKVFVDGLLKQGLKLRGGVRQGGGWIEWRRLEAPIGDERKGGWPGAKLNFRIRRRGLGEDILEEGLFGLCGANAADEAGDSRAVGDRGCSGCDDLFDLGSDQKAVTVKVIEQRLYTKSVARDHDPAAPNVDNDDCPHAVKAPETIDAPLCVGGEDDLGISDGGEAMANPPQLGA